MPSQSFSFQQRQLKTLSFTLGFTSIIGQIVLLREFITVFYGNETSYAVVLAGWLFWIAMGSLVFGLAAGRIKSPALWTEGILLSNLFVLPLTVAAVRAVKVFWHIRTGEIIGMMPMLLSAFVTLAPLTFILGGLFTLLCRYAETLKDTDARREVGTVYVWESAGAGLGGLVFSLFLVQWMPAMTAAVFVGAVNVYVLLMVFKRRHLPVYRVGFVLLLAVMVLTVTGALDRFDRWTRSVQWRGLDVIDVVDSPYGNLAMTKIGREFSLFENGLLSYSTNDVLSAEENVHFAMLAHHRPHRVLLVGNGIGGALKEVLKYKGVWVDHVELDARAIDISMRHLPALDRIPLEDPRVTTVNQDARLFVKRSPRIYDVVIINLPGPYTELLNRFYSLEFFREVRRVLTPKGVLSFSVPASENYVSPQARDFLRSLATTLRQVFPSVKVIPGDTDIFLAGAAKGGITLDPAIYVRRLQERNITSQYVSAYYLPFRMNQWRISQQEEMLKKEGRINTDTRPVAFLYDIVLWSTHFNSVFAKFIGKLSGLRFYHLLIVPLVIFVLGWIRARFSPAAPVSLSVMTTGFSEIIYQVVVILAFQALYGYAYYRIGLIMASFMVGLVLGSLTARRMTGYSRHRLIRSYGLAQAGIVVYPLLLPLLFVVFENTVTGQVMTGVLATTFAFLPVVAGFLGGVQYPLAVFLVHRGGRQGRPASKSAGLLYALDVLGAMAGALVTGSILVPLLGINAMAYFCVVLNGAVLILFLAKIKRLEEINL